MCATIVLAASCSEEVVTEHVWLSSAPSTAIYVDAESGSDDNQGRSPEYAIQSIERLNELNPMLGDTILMRGGYTYIGSIELNSIQSTESHPLYVSSYGEGVATIDGETELAISAQWSSYITIENICVTNDDYVADPAIALSTMLNVDESTHTLTSDVTTSAESINIVMVQIVKNITNE